MSKSLLGGFVRKRIGMLSFVLIASLSLSCNKKEDDLNSTDIEETAQQIGDVMASLDEAGGSSGALAQFEAFKSNRSYVNMFSPSKGVSNFAFSEFMSLLLPPAHATSCALASTYGSCTNNVITRNFSDCSIGSATLSGTVTLTWSDAGSDNTCAITANGHSITRVPDFTLVGRRGGTLSVSKSGSVGQVITRTSAGVFSFSNDGLRRVISYLGTTLFDFTSQTSGDLTITGNSRSGRTLNSTGGAGISVINNLTGVSCTYVPQNLSWESACNCATSGSWSATCSDGKSSSLTITGCGTGGFTMGEDSGSVTMDRCYSI